MRSIPHSTADEALTTLKRIGVASVVVSDMRMPGMDGATLLEHVMTSYPNTTRILLTGEPGRDAAIAAVNNPRISRFLTKPCAQDQLRAAPEAGVMARWFCVTPHTLLETTSNGRLKFIQK